jgi:hypothetical protein
VKLEKHIRRYTSIAAVIDMLRRKEFTLLDPTSWDDRNDGHFMELYKGERGVGALYAACATTSSQTYHHWRVFTHGADGACMELRREPLEAALLRIPEVRFREMDYLTITEIEELDKSAAPRLPFIKRGGFAAELEYRIIAEVDEVQREAIGIQMAVSWIRKIDLNPWLPRSLAQSITETIHAIAGCEKLSVGRSLLIENSQWKRAGDKIVGVTPGPRLVLKKGRSLKAK